ncbi:hypothetical protein D3C85_1910520 [compost metagenome]
MIDRRITAEVNRPPVTGHSHHFFAVSECFHGATAVHHVVVALTARKASKH